MPKIINISFLHKNRNEKVKNLDFIDYIAYMQHYTIFSFHWYSFLDIVISSSLNFEWQ